MSLSSWSMNLENGQLLDSNQSLPEKNSTGVGIVFSVFNRLDSGSSSGSSLLFASNFVFLFRRFNSLALDR